MNWSKRLAIQTTDTSDLIKDIINLYIINNCLLKNTNFSIQTSNE